MKANPAMTDHPSPAVEAISDEHLQRLHNRAATIAHVMLYLAVTAITGGFAAALWVDWRWAPTGLLAALVALTALGVSGTIRVGAEKELARRARISRVMPQINLQAGSIMGLPLNSDIAAALGIEDRP